jgi:hypothetical protein
MFECLVAVFVGVVIRDGLKWRECSEEFERFEGKFYPD